MMLPVSQGMLVGANILDLGMAQGLKIWVG